MNAPNNSIIAAVIPANPPIRRHFDDLGDVTIIGWAVDHDGNVHPIYADTERPDIAFVDFIVI